MHVDAPRILVIKLSSLGDLFHALPAVHSIRSGMQGRVDWVTQTEYVELVRCFTDVERVIPFSRRKFFRGLPALWSEIRAESYDLVVDLQGLLKSGIVTAMARARRKVGPAYWREGARIFYPEVGGSLNRNRHAVDQALDLVKHLGLPVLRAEFPVEFPEPELPGDRPRVAMVPVSRWESKNWPPGAYAELAALLRDRCGVSVVLIGGAADRATCDEIAAAAGDGVENLAGRLSLPETGGVLKQCELVISNDSGPVHMAVAVGTPTLAIFGPTDPVRTGPYGSLHRVVRAPQPCQPCFQRRCVRFGLACLLELSPQQVFRVAEVMLQSARSGVTVAK